MPAFGGIDRPATHAGINRSAAAARARVDVIDPAGLLPPADSAWLAERARAAVEHLGAGGEVRARLVNDEAMAAAHERYSSVPGTTDVLTFDLRDGEDPAAPLDTDLLLCVDEAARQAGGRGHAVRLELLLYAVHGVLHCLGEDDHDEAAAARMHAREDEVLTALGLGAVYGRGEREGGRGA